ncbi:sensor histidine kinase [Comamonas serinivorans]|uniref:sensor histidine kinase n=1 Tax=Comamonas serinivorans TaxID=1082851 RepID=UPI001F01068B|nr:histidine kinase [Comamonas serinivorans]
MTSRTPAKPVRDAARASGAADSVGVSSSVLLFDACHAGVVLRVVLAVELVVAVAAMFVTDEPWTWVTQVSLWTAGVLPGCLLWLVLACALKQGLARLPTWLQYACGAALGMLAGLFAVLGLYHLGLLAEVRGVAGACSGAMAAAVLMSDLQLRARGREPAAARARLAELQSRIRPHFLFNTLNSAIALIRESPRQAERVLEDLAELFRHVLGEARETTTLAAELDLAQRYLEIEQVRFGDRLRLHWHVDESAGEARLPPLVLQPLVENTIRHGVEPSVSGAQVWVSTQRRGDTVVIKVRNSLPGGAGQPGNGLALANVRERLALLHDVQSSFRAGLVATGVYEVRIRIPLEGGSTQWPVTRVQPRPDKHKEETP